MSAQRKPRIPKGDAEREKSHPKDPAASNQAFLSQAVEVAVRAALRREADSRRSEEHGRHRSRFNTG